MIDPLVSALRRKYLLLVLDSFEHLLHPAPVWANLLGPCAKVKALLTSRKALHVYSEHVAEVGPLALPDLSRPLDADALRAWDATTCQHLWEGALDSSSGWPKTVAGQVTRCSRKGFQKKPESLHK